MNRFASPVIQVVFEGPDVHEQSLYDLFRVRSLLFNTLYSLLNRYHSHMGESRTYQLRPLLLQAPFASQP